MPLTSPLYVLQDSGAPEDSAGHTTVVLFHGYAWHSGIFARLIPLAHTHNARILLVNRRGYPGSEPYTEAERALLASASAQGDTVEAATALESLTRFMRERAREVYDLLVELVKEGNVAAANREQGTGGIIVAGWSFGSGLMTALLANLASFPANEVKISQYVRRVVFLDPPHHTLGFPPPENPYNPLFDLEIPHEERERVFTNWVSGYYVHGDTIDSMERKTPLRDPPPTLSTLTPEEVARALYLPPGGPGGSDEILLNTGLKLGLFATLREGALYLPEGETQGDLWLDTEVRYVSCERSVWEMPWGTLALKEELAKSRKAGRPLRNVRLVFVKGANHFICWDQPELALRALIGGKDIVA
ncbi:Alpha/Beta hydrolase protein [Trametes elegans]|nr:Alpha/Beta hydrolase protein [Trametes elegans]